MTPNQAMQHFIDAGWSPVQAAGMVGGFMGESSLNPAAYNPNDPGGSIGLAQWNGPRRTAFEQFAGDKARDPFTQLSFANNELRSTEGHAGKMLSSADTLEKAVAANLAYERPKGYTSSDVNSMPAFAKRLEYAQNAYNGYTNGVAAPASTAPPQQAPAATELTGLLAKLGVQTSGPAGQGLLARMRITHPDTSALSPPTGLIAGLKNGNFSGLKDVGNAMMAADQPAQQAPAPMQPIQQQSSPSSVPQTNYVSGGGQSQEDMLTSILKMLGVK